MTQPNSHHGQLDCCFRVLKRAAWLSTQTVLLGAMVLLSAFATNHPTLPPQETLPVAQSIEKAQRQTGPDNHKSQESESQEGGNQEGGNQEGIVECNITLLSGRVITGELIRQDTLIVVIGIDGIETTFSRNRITSITILPPVADRYHQMRKAISDQNIDARLTLIEWLRARRAYSLAIKELESILIEYPTNPRAKLLHTWLTEYAKLGENPSPSKKRNTGSIPPSSRDAPSPKHAKRTPLRNQTKPLSTKQINLMRVYEIDLRDPPRLRVPDETLNTLIARHPNDFPANEDERKALFKISEIEKLKLLFTHKARDLYEQVVVLEDPHSMELFKKNVHSQRGWILNTCASTRCHGGTEAGRLQLINTQANSPETIYTNFFILEQYTLADGSPLINYQEPERSPLLQMAMIEKNALTPHPQIPKDFPGTGFRPIFRSTRDRKYRDAIEWIQAMYQPRPKYDFESPLNPTSPPTPSPSQPSTKPPQTSP